MRITRREFLKWSGANAIALGVIPLFNKDALARFLEADPEHDPMGLLIDTTRCIGCRACQLACKQKNHLPPDASRLPPNETFPKELSATTYTLVEFHRVGGDESAPVFRSVKKQCMHCLQPACASVCPVGAITKTAKGPVVYDADKCMGCRYCMAACPFNIPKFEWNSPNPRIRKCDLCADRIEQGLVPACVEACPVQALQFGSRKALVAEAQARVSREPDKYVPYLYGLAEVGGTSVLYLADVPFEKLGFNVNLPTTPLPDLTWQAMEKIPTLVIGIGLLLSGIAWWRGRKKRGETSSEERGLEGDQPAVGVVPPVHENGDAKSYFS